MDVERNFTQIHDECGWHEKAVKESGLCGCFHCLGTFSPSEIEEWIDEPETSPRGKGRTAICPKCGIDSVLPESDHLKITTELLKDMNKEYFQMSSATIKQ